MTTVTAMTYARAKEIEDTTIVDGTVVGNNLILMRRDGITIDAGDVRGLTGSPGVTQSELNTSLAQVNTALAQGAPVGMVCDYIGTTPPNLWLSIEGQTIVNGQSLHPLLWAILPASMKSGANIVFPNAKGRVTVGYDSTDVDFNAIGKTGGSKTHTLTQGQTPLKSHNHTLTDPTHAHTVNSHSHGGLTGFDTPNHSHSGITAGMNQNQSHSHMPGGTSSDMPLNFVRQSDGGTGPANQAFVIQAGPYTIGISNTTDIRNIDHVHSFNTSGVSVNHQHGIPAESPNTDFRGTGITLAAASDTSATPHNIVQPYVVLLKIIKAA